MSKNSIHSNNTEIFSARSEKKQTVSMKGINGVFHVLWPLSYFIHSNSYQAANAVSCAGETEMRMQWRCPVGPQRLLEETSVNTIAL